MTEREARQLDLEYTGHGSHDRQKMSQKAKSIRRLGYKAEVTTRKPDGLSRGPYANCNWYNIYTDKNYYRDQHKTYKLENSWIRMENNIFIETRYIGENLYYLIQRDDLYLGSEWAKQLNVTGKLLCSQLRDGYNAVINDNKVALFNTLDDAKNALEWVNSVMLFNKLEA